jgi:hypothetical protein
MLGDSLSQGCLEGSSIFGSVFPLRTYRPRDVCLDIRQTERPKGARPLVGSRRRSTRISRRHLFGRRPQSRSRRFLQGHRGARGRGSFLGSVGPAWCAPRGRRRWHICIAENDGQPVLPAADDDDLRIRRLRQLKRCFDAAPTQIRFRNALADGLLEIANPFCLDPLAFRLSFFALDPKLVFFRNVVLLCLAIDGGHYGRGQFDASHEYVIKDDGVPHGDSV